MSTARESGVAPSPCTTDWSERVSENLANLLFRSTGYRRASSLNQTCASPFSEKIPFEGDVPLYARVDGCIVDGELRLMELEVLEPELFLRCAPESAGRLADALLARMV